MKEVSKGAKTLVIEEGGKPLIGFLKKSDLFKRLGCRYGDKNCLVEQNKECAKMSVIYEITCNSCMEPINTEPDIDSRSRDPGNQGRYQYIGMTWNSELCTANLLLEASWPVR